MSYTKMNQEITKYLIENDLPHTGNSRETKAETEKRLEAYALARDTIFTRWIDNKKYRELISCARGGWFPENEFFIPLAEHLAEEQEWIYLKVLCEPWIKSAADGLLSILSAIKRDSPGITAGDIINIDLEQYRASRKYDAAAEAAGWRKKALFRLNTYLGYLSAMEDHEYRPLIVNIRDKIESLQIKKKDIQIPKTVLL